jgi:CheY-like chemotaxis protein
MSKILIVEDEKVISDIQKKNLERAGFSCDVASDGIKALKLLKQHQYDLIVMDVVMPHMDGFTLLKEVKNAERTKNVPVITLTNLSQEEDKQECLKYEDCIFMLKTETSLEDLVSEVHKQLGVGKQTV